MYHIHLFSSHPTSYSTVNVTARWQTLAWRVRSCSCPRVPDRSRTTPLLPTTSPPGGIEPRRYLLLPRGQCLFCFYVCFSSLLVHRHWCHQSGFIRFRNSNSYADNLPFSLVFVFIYYKIRIKDLHLPMAFNFWTKPKLFIFLYYFLIKIKNILLTTYFFRVHMYFKF